MFDKLFKKIDGWKQVIGTLMLQLPVGGDVLLRESAEAFIKNPTIETVFPLAAQLVLIGGALHRIIKNVKNEK